jgi:hypothetical protein
MSNTVNATQSSYLEMIVGSGQPTDTYVSNHDGNVVIDTRLGHDQVNISQQGSFLYVIINGTEKVVVDLTKAKSVTIEGGSGNDRISVGQNVTFPLTINGGNGQDVIMALNPGHNDITGGNGVDAIYAKPTDHFTYGEFLKVVEGQGTVCVPVSCEAHVPPPSPSIDETQQLWNELVNSSLNQSSVQHSQEACMSAEEKMKRLQILLQAALASGNIDLAILLISGLETHQANQVAAGLLNRIQQLQTQRQNLATEMGKLGEKDGAKLTELNNLASNVGTEIQMIQMFLQDVMSQKSEAQQLGSNYLKSRHDTAQSIIRNFA